MVLGTLTVLVCSVVAVLAVLSIVSDTFLRKLPVDGGCETANNTPDNKVSVIIVADNNARELRANLDKFLQQDHPAGYEVIIVVDKDEDGTSDVLKSFACHPNLYTTFVPSSSRYMSRRKLAITLGVKAAKNEWILLTDASCSPETDKWIASMAATATSSDGVDMVMGYSNYSNEASHFKRFCRFRKEYALMHEAFAGTAYGMEGNNLMFRKSMFMAGNGFQGNLKYLRGEYYFLVNKYAAKGNTAVNTSSDSHIIEEAPTKKEWNNKNVFHFETRKHLKRNTSHRLPAANDMISFNANLLCGAVGVAYSAVTGDWIALSVSAVAIVLPLVTRTLNAKRAMAAFGVCVPAWKAVPFETGLIWHRAKHALSYKLADKYDFISHKS